MTTRGDLLMYRGVEPVPGKFLSYAEDDNGWKVVVELNRPVAAIWRVEVNGYNATTVDFLGLRVVVFYIPEQAIRKGESLTGFLQNSVIRILADTYLRDLGTSPDSNQLVSVSIGFGTSPQISDKMEEAVQRCIRFLLMSDDPMQPDRGGRILQMRKRGLLPVSVAQRMIETACQAWNRYPRRTRSSARWNVRQVQPISVRYLTWDLIEKEWGLVPLSESSDLSGRQPSSAQGRDRVLATTLRMTVTRGDESAELASAITV